MCDSKQRNKRAHILLQDSGSERSAIHLLLVRSFILGDFEDNPQEQNDSDSVQGQLASHSLSDYLHPAACNCKKYSSALQVRTSVASINGLIVPRYEDIGPNHRPENYLAKDMQIKFGTSPHLAWALGIGVPSLIICTLLSS